MINRFHQLEPREKLFLAVGAIFILLIVGIFGIYRPYQNAVIEAERSIVSKQRQLDQLRELVAEYKTLQNRMQRAEAKLDGPAGGSALALLEGLAVRIGSRENLNYIRPQPPQVEGAFRIENLDAKLEKLTLQQVVRLLWELERSETLLQVKNLHLKQRFDDETRLDATLTVSALRRSQ